MQRALTLHLGRRTYRCIQLRAVKHQASTPVLLRVLRPHPRAGVPSLVHRGKRLIASAISRDNGLRGIRDKTTNAPRMFEVLVE